MNVRKSVSLLWLPLSIALVATGCNKEAPAEAPAEEAASTEAAPEGELKIETPAPAAQPAPGTDAVVVEDHSSPASAATGFDIEAFAGTYAVGQSTLEAGVDGSFTLNDNGNVVKGTWTAQPDGKAVLLDPESKGEADRTVEIVSKDSVKIAGATLQRKQG